MFLVTPLDALYITFSVLRTRNVALLEMMHNTSLFIKRVCRLAGHNTLQFHMSAANLELPLT